LKRASVNGFVDVMTLLLFDSRVDPSAHDNTVFRNSCTCGFDTLVQMLLANPCVDPLAQDNVAVKMASSMGHHAVVKLLLADPRVDPAADDNFAIAAACFVKDHWDGLAIAHGQWIPVREMNENQAKVVNMLLADPRVYPTSHAIVNASEHGRIKLLEMMLAHPGAVVSKDALVVADHKGQSAAIRLLTTEQPQVTMEICRSGAIACTLDGPLQK
jgi:hypothetical protein